MSGGHGLIIAAPGSGSGKTTVTLGLLRALRDKGVNVRGAKSGPDYIDPRFHEAASGAVCMNLDAWAMTPARVRSLAAGDGLMIIEGAMGLFDGAPPDGKGACADLARMLGLPVVLVVDAAHVAQSVAPLVAGFARHDPRVKVAGVILNKVGSDRHERMLRMSLDPIGIPVLGALRRETGIEHPSRHLGLVQADERPDLQEFLKLVSEQVRQAVDLDALQELAAPLPGAGPQVGMPPPAQRIAIARDEAFAFAYPHLLRDWRTAGAELSFFSPLADEAPGPADLVILPGGYPELHAGRIAAAENFRAGMLRAKEVYGECGGYMVMGQTLTDANGAGHQMLGLLNLRTNFQKRRLHLGYRSLTAKAGPFSGQYSAHEFHYATTELAKGDSLFSARDAENNDLGPMGLRQGKSCGSFAHLIDVIR
ncbi:MAG: cobyrinate a,c-diamide synthase [Paracoccaceae bacterium]|nr:cobyrinate a,c-diamide synthase [Paracoccaceae bacterium]